MKLLIYNIEKPKLYLIYTLFYRSYNREKNSIKLFQLYFKCDENVPLCLLS